MHRPLAKLAKGVRRHKLAKLEERRGEEVLPQRAAAGQTSKLFLVL